MANAGKDINSEFFRYTPMSNCANSAKKLLSRMINLQVARLQTIIRHAFLGGGDRLMIEDGYRAIAKELSAA